MVKIIHFLNKYLKYINVELATFHQVMRPASELNNPNYQPTTINPATGLAISGSVDASGRTYGSGSDDYYRSQTINTSISNPSISSYDPYRGY